MKRMISAGLFASILLLNAACNQKQEPLEEAQAINEEEFEDTAVEETKDELSEFMTRAASGGMMEVELGNLAQQKAQHADVKAFGQMMVTDHSKANEELEALAASEGLSLPDTMSQEHMDHVTELRQKTGAEFDQAYMNLMVEDHEEDVELFEEAAQNLEDPEVKSYASKTVVTLQQHLERARQINETLKNRNN